MIGNILDVSQFANFSAAVLKALPRNMTPEDARRWEQNGEKLTAALASALSPLATPAPREKPKLLKLLGTTLVSARDTMFVARDHFKVATVKKDKVKIFFVGENFTTYFLTSDGKVEPLAVAHELAYYELIKRSLDRPIVNKLGGEGPSETTLADIWIKMEAHGGGEDGDLLTNGYANIFYVRDAAGELRVVGVRWRGGGWSVRAVPLSSPGEWGAGGRVFASNSVPSTL